jgi:hypothetical protein
LLLLNNPAERVLQGFKRQVPFHQDGALDTVFRSGGRTDPASLLLCGEWKPSYYVVGNVDCSQNFLLLID